MHAMTDAALQARERDRQLIVERARRPRFSGVLEPADAIATADNPSCGDRVSLTLRFSADGQRLEVVRCATRGCVLCNASADLMAEVVSGLTADEALERGRDFVGLLQGQVGSGPAACDPALAPLQPLMGVRARARCALLPWQALAKALACGV